MDFDLEALKTNFNSGAVKMDFDSESVEIRFFTADSPLAEKERDRLIETLRGLPRSQGTVIQAFDSSRVYGKRHLISALYHALRSKESGLSRSRDLSVDVVRYAAGERQIHVAFEKVGLRKGTRGIAVLVYSPEMEIEGIPETLTRIMKENGFRETEEPAVDSEKELEALERTALLDLKL